MPSQPTPIMQPPYAAQSYRTVYRRQETNHCPGCGHANWLVGRKLAECARCATAMPLAECIQDEHELMAHSTAAPASPKLRAID